MKHEHLVWSALWWLSRVLHLVTVTERVYWMGLAQDW